MKQQLLEKFQVPPEVLKPPELNPELKSKTILSPENIKRDCYQVGSQQQVLASLMAHDHALQHIWSDTVCPKEFKDPLDLGVESNVDRLVLYHVNGTQTSYIFFFM